MSTFHTAFRRCLQQGNIEYINLDVIMRRSFETKLKLLCHYRTSLETGIKNKKVDGRYPFLMIMHFTEFCSSLFSMFNLIAHLYLYSKHIKDIRKLSALNNLYYKQHLIICACWLFSTLFHMNETTLTRNLDYFAAFLFLLFSNYISICRLQLIMKRNVVVLFIRKVMEHFYPACFILQIFYMSFVNFNYKLHKTVCSILFVITFMLWHIIFYKLKKLSYAKYLIIYAYLVFFGALIEGSDFEPIYHLIDAHALWHLITACVAPVYYIFLKNDIAYENSIFLKSN